MAAICRRLDGIPLELELAAPSLHTPGPAALLALIEECAEPLDAAPGTSRFRHQTLWASLNRSYGLLSREEAALLRLLSVFAGSFTLNDLVGVSGHLERSAEDIAASIEALAAKSLVTVACFEGGLRYRLMHSMQCFAARRLRSDEEDGPALRSHARYLLRVLEQADVEWTYQGRKEWAARHGSRADDLLKALDWAFGDGGDAEVGVRLTVHVTCTRTRRLLLLRL